MPAGRSAILSGDRADGTQQRLRFGLGEFKPYRYRGKPGWNPAKVLDEFPGERWERNCGKCGAKAGEACRGTASGKPMRSYHVER